MNSAMLLTGSAFATDTMIGATATSEIGANPLTGSNFNLPA
jgi:hypothetical protein